MVSMNFFCSYSLCNVFIGYFLFPFVSCDFTKVCRLYLSKTWKLTQQLQATGQHCFKDHVLFLFFFFSL